MKTKVCIKCGIEKSVDSFYGVQGDCKICFLITSKKNRTKIKRNCLICGKEFGTCHTEIRRGGGKTCSRKCYYKRFKKIVKRGKKSPNYKGKQVSKNTIHRRLEDKLGKPIFCEHCKTTDKNKYYDWANKSGKYLEDVSDWIRLCRSCHTKFDYTNKIKKYYKSLRKNPYFNFKYSELNK